MSYLVWSDPAFPDHLVWAKIIGETVDSYRVRISKNWTRSIPKSESSVITSEALRLDLDRYGHPAKWRLQVLTG